MKHLSRLLCLLLTLALLLPAALAEEADLEDGSTDTILHVDDVEELYQVGSMVSIDDTLYTIAYGPTLYRYDGENWRIANLITNSSESLFRFSDDDSFYADGSSAVLSAGADSESLLLLYPYSDGMIDLLRIPLDGSDATRLHSFRLVDDASENTYCSLQGATIAGDFAYVTVYGLNPEALYGLNTLYELNLRDGSVRKVTEDYISIVLPLDDTSLLGLYTNRYSGQEDTLTAIVRINRQTGLTETLCELESDSSYSGFTMSGSSVVFNDGSQVLRVAAPYDTVETIGYLPPTNVSSTLPGCVSNNRYFTYNYDTGLTSIDLTAPLPATVLRLDQQISWGTMGDLVREYAAAHPEVGIVYASTTASSAPDFTQHMQSAEALDIYNFTLPVDSEAFLALRNKGYLADLSGSADLLASVSEMFPNLTKQILTDGHLYALPYDMTNNCWAINTAVLEDVGLSAEDVPTTYLELLNLIDEWITSYAEEYPEHALLDYPSYLTSNLFGQLMLEQIAECEADGRTLTFNDPDFIATLNKLDSMRERIQAYEDQWNEDNNVGSIAYIGGTADAGVNNSPLLTSYYVIDIKRTNNYYGFDDDEDTTVPLMLSIQPNRGGSVISYMNVLGVNRSSKNVDAATALLTYLANNCDDYQKALFSPNYTDNIEDPYYEETKTSYEGYIEELTKAMETADDSEKRDYQETITTLQNALERLSPYEYTTEKILLYDEQMTHVTIIETTVFYGEENEASTLINRYMDGNITVDQFVRELTRIVQMMILENS